jgi:hypothetical protein
MTNRDRQWLGGALFASLLLVASCGKKEAPAGGAAAPAPSGGQAAPSAPEPAPSGDPFAYAGLEIGNSLGPDGRVQKPTLKLARTDTQYFVVLNKGGGKVAFRVFGTFQDGSPFVDETRIVEVKGASTEFHVAPPTGGWKPGKYAVRILINGETAASQEYDIE